MSDYEPPAEMVEALAKDMRNNAGVTVTDYARFVLRRQHERELALREATRMAVIRAFETDTEDGWSDAMVKFRMDAYDAAHAKLDAPKVPEAPTLLEAAKAVLVRGSVFMPRESDWAALKDAVEREEKR